MANTSSFYYYSSEKWQKRVNTACFSSMREPSKEGEYIIIEKNKHFFPHKKIIEYLRDLKLMGFEFRYTFNKKEEEFHIFPFAMKNRHKRVAFFMAVRYLWEGYKPDYGGNNYDDFRRVVHHYFKLKELYPKEHRLRLLCLACNCFLKGGTNYNSNHFFSGRPSCKIVTDINEITKGTSVNGFFMNSKSEPNIKTDSNYKKWSKKSYVEMYKYYIQ